MESTGFAPLDSLNLYAVTPKEDCPHQTSLNFDKIACNLTKEKLKAPCEGCNSTHENWMCLICYNVYCSRYFNSHMVHHNEKTGHDVAQSFADASFWCYSCDSYIYSKDLRVLALKFSALKFPDAKNSVINADTIAKELAGIDAEHRVEEKEESQGFSRKDLVQGMKNKSFKRIIFLTGAGMSVSAGIPDFRSETGIYAQLGECNLPYPEAIFDIGYFKEHPETFYKLAKTIMSYHAKPTIAHYFLKILADEGLLFLDFTQNVDGLEIEAGIDPEFLVEAHGHTRSAHCALCGKEHSIEDLKKHIHEEKIYRCECSGPVKPDIILFGEALPGDFFAKVDSIKEGDLVFVIGTSLRVFPFASLVHMIPKEVPIVLINRENTAITRDNFLFLQGEIDERVKELIKDVGWEKNLEILKGKL